MDELKMLPAAKTPAEMLVVYFDAERLSDYLKITSSIRHSGVGVEIYPEPKKLAKQLQYANKKGFRLALIAGSDELSKGECQIKDLTTGESTTVSIENAPAEAIRMLGVS